MQGHEGLEAHLVMDQQPQGRGPAAVSNMPRIIHAADPEVLRPHQPRRRGQGPPLRDIMHGEEHRRPQADGIPHPPVASLQFIQHLRLNPGDSVPKVYKTAALPAELIRRPFKINDLGFSVAPWVPSWGTHGAQTEELGSDLAGRMPRSAVGSNPGRFAKAASPVRPFSS
jgi:hypothetical protein